MKKKLFAGLLAITILSTEILPAFAIDDTVVSENEVSEEDAAAEEESAAKEADEDNAVFGDAVEEDTPAEENADVTEEDAAPEDAVDMDASDAAAVLEQANVTLVSERLISEENGEQIWESVYAVGLPADEASSENTIAAECDTGYAEEEAYDASLPSHIYSNSPVTRTIDAGYYQFITKGYYGYSTYNFSLNTTITYNSRINYRGKAIKAVGKDSNDQNQLYASVKSSGLFSMAAQLSPTGSYSITENGERKDVIEFKFYEKKNKNANSDSYFTVKARVNTKVAKKIGYSKKYIRAMKKAVKKFNKVAKKDKMPFVIGAIDFDALHNTFLKSNYYLTYTISWKNYVSHGEFLVKILDFSVRCLITPDQVGSSASLWTKPPKNEVSVKKLDGCTYITTAKNKNYHSKGYWTIYISFEGEGPYKRPVAGNYRLTQTR